MYCSRATSYFRKKGEDNFACLLGNCGYERSIMREVGLMLFVACFITIRSREEKKEKIVEYKFCSSVSAVCSTLSTSFFTAELHVIDVIALCAVSLLCPSLAIVVLVLTVSFGFAFSA